MENDDVLFERHASSLAAGRSKSHGYTASGGFESKGNVEAVERRKRPDSESDAGARERKQQNCKMGWTRKEQKDSGSCEAKVRKEPAQPQTKGMLGMHGVKQVRAQPHLEAA
jgi:hypothetical protein